MKKNFSKKIVTANIVGGLGNQLFQIANVLAYAWKYSLKPVFKKIHGSPSLASPRSVYWETVFRRLPITDQLPSKLFVLNNKDSSYHKHPSPKKIFRLRNKQGIIFYGYYQSARYFDIYREKLFKNIFYIEPSKKEYLKKKYIEIFNKDIISISLHIRRGDYLKLPKVFTNLSETDYYKKSINHLQEKLDESNYKFIIFSDDQDWSKIYLKTNFSRLDPIFPFEKDYLELYLMSCCNHQIIANSSFSWWGAYLNNFSEKIVIAPKNWYGPHRSPNKDIYMKDWIKI